MKRSFRTEIPSKYILYALVILGVVLLIASYTTGFIGGPIRTVAEYVFVPMQKGLGIVGAEVSNNAAEAASREELLQENALLQEEVEMLRTQLASVQVRESELEDLRSLMELRSEYSQYETTGAYVIGRGGSNWFNSFTIDKGASDGIEENMNVIAGGGLVGIVTAVGDHHAVVRAIIDDTSNVSAMVAKTEDNCIISGSLETMTESGMVMLTSLEDREDEVRVGDSVVTSRISNQYLPGLMIGYISELEWDANGLTKSGRVTPVADFKHLSEVLVILEVKETGGL